MSRVLSIFTVLCPMTLSAVVSCSPVSDPAGAPAASAVDTASAAEEQAVSEHLEALVSRMAAVGYSIGPSWAPQGNQLAFVSSASGVPQVWVAEAAGGNLEQITQFEDSVGGVAWSPAGDILAVSVAPGGGLNTQLYLVPAQGGEPQLITAGGEVNNWLGEWSADGRYLTYSSNVDGSDGMDCWLYDAQTGASRKIATNQGIGVCQLSPDNMHAVAWRMQSRGNSNIFLIDLETGGERVLTPHVGTAEANQAEFIDANSLLISTNIDREMIALARVDLGADGTPGPVNYIAGRQDAELAGFELLADGRVALMWNAAGRSELQFLDLATGKISQAPSLPGEIASDMEASPDGLALALTISGAASPNDVWVLDLEYGAFMQVSDSPHEGIDLNAFIRPELVTYTAHDGLKLSGWLYRPASVIEAGPMVLNFHGGPEGQERPAFRSIYQALVASGISVFAPNVRGSAGFGKTFVSLDNGALRFDGIRDIESTVAFVIESGLAEKGRIGIMGGSYGGYMVMAGLTSYPDMFAAGANLFGVVNFETFFANTEPWMAAISTVEYGDPIADRELLRQLSPIHKVDRVVAPTIVLHGANDTNVPVVEAEQVVNNLEQRGVPVKYVLFPDEGHGWRKTENRVTSDVEIVTWFSEHL